MLKLPDKEMSYWRVKAGKSVYPKLKKDMEVDVAIVGGGICGISTAYLLTKSGLKVAVIEKATIGSGTTGHTTGKVTSQHNIIYDELRGSLGYKNAQMYGEANQTAVEQVEKIIKKEKIDCGWRREDNYVFTDRSDQVGKFKLEARTAAGLGLPASFETKIPLPFKIKGAVKFSNQGKINAQAYVSGLAASVKTGGGHIFENSTVTGIRDGNPGRVSTKDAKVIARHIVVATNVPTFPLAARGAYCILEYPTTSYIVAGRVKNKVSGMYISPDDDHFSVLPVSDGSKHFLFIGGRNHIRGPRRREKRFQELADYGEQKFGMSSIEYKWSAWDYLAYDSVPLVGKAYPWSKNLYVATAFKKWGLSGTTAAAMIMHDTILGNENPWTDTFNSLRLSPIKSIPKVAASYLKIR